MSAPPIPRTALKVCARCLSVLCCLFPQQGKVWGEATPLYATPAPIEANAGSTHALCKPSSLVVGGHPSPQAREKATPGSAENNAWDTHGVRPIAANPQSLQVCIQSHGHGLSCEEDSESRLPGFLSAEEPARKQVSKPHFRLCLLPHENPPL